jgi:hypothetical protein
MAALFFRRIFGLYALTEHVLYADPLIGQIEKD